MAELQDALQRRQQMEAGSIWASEITPRLYLGRGQDASNLHQLQLHGITHILNVADDVENFHPKMFTYANLKVVDFGGDKGIKRVFPQAKKFIQSIFDDCVENKVLVHCANGSNRSATVVIALLMMLPLQISDGDTKASKMCLKDAYDFVKKRHPATVPLKDNKTQLKDFERELRGTSICSMVDDDFK